MCDRSINSNYIWGSLVVWEFVCGKFILPTNSLSAFVNWSVLFMVL